MNPDDVIESAQDRLYAAQERRAGAALVQHEAAYTAAVRATVDAAGDDLLPPEDDDLLPPAFDDEPARARPRYVDTVPLSNVTVAPMLPRDEDTAEAAFWAPKGAVRPAKCRETRRFGSCSVDRSKRPGTTCVATTSATH